MKVINSNKIALVLVIASNLILLPLANFSSQSNIIFYGEPSLMNYNLKTSRISNKIFINGTSDWTDFRNAGNCTGSGTYSDPYVIKDLIIDGGGSGNCIHLENSNVFFRIENCTIFNSGFEIYFGMPFGAGIMLYNVSNGFIENNSLISNCYGIISWGINTTISQNIVSNNTGGIFSMGKNNLVCNNSVNNNYEGISASGGCRVLENTVINNDIGIAGGNDATILLNNVSFNKIHGMVISGWEDDFIADNYINNNNGTGILCTAYYSDIVRNEINNNKEDGIHLKPSTYDSYGNYTVPCLGNLISQNSINNNFCGIRLNITQHTDVINNSISNNQISGIEINQGSMDNISNNEINENYYGIRILHSQNSNIFQNIINHNHYGVYLNSSEGN
ncbi:MAG: NosD domain-containing protein, partial [Promethearchaeota archaeon]